MDDYWPLYYDPTDIDWVSDEPQTVLGTLKARQVDFRAKFETPDPDEPIVGVM